MANVTPDPQIAQREEIKSLIKELKTMEPAVLVEDMDYHRMRAVVRLKRRLITGDAPRQKAPGNLGKQHRGQYAVSAIIFECPVHHGKNKFGLNRIRYKKGDDVTVIFSHRAKDELVRYAHGVNIDPIHKRMLHLQDAFVLLGFMCDTDEPKAPKDKSDEIGLNRIEMSKDDWVHYWGRFGTAGWGARIYTTPEGDHVIHPRIGRHVYLEERARWNILFAQPCNEKYSNHGNFGMPGPGDPPVIPSFWWYPFSEWSPFHWVDNPFNF